MDDSIPPTPTSGPLDGPQPQPSRKLALIVLVLGLAASLYVAAKVKVQWIEQRSTLSTYIKDDAKVAYKFNGQETFIENAGPYADQCSPISDTTILSSMTTGCDLTDHVKTQLVPATLAAVLAAILWTATVALFA